MNGLLLPDTVACLLQVTATGPELSSQGKKRKAASTAPKKGKGKKAAAALQQAEGGSTDDDSEEEEEAPAKQKAAKQATHVGRYHKRESAKRVQGYSASDLAAILGAPSGGAGDAEASAYPGEVRAAHRQEDSDASSSGHVSGSDDDRGDAPISRREGESDVPLPARSWWSGLFVKAGRMGSTKHELRSRKVQGEAAAAAAAAGKPAGFSEQDQEDLAMKVLRLNRCIYSMLIGRPA